jgi:hypothetical protein
MGKDTLFWILMLLFALYGVLSGRVDPAAPNSRYYVWSGSLLYFLLFLVIGWSLYGPPIK